MKLETLRARLSRPQLVAIISRLGTTEDSRLRELELAVDSGIFNISSLDPEVVARAFIKLQTVGLNFTFHLTISQVSALISRICHSPYLRLSELVLRNKYISLVHPEVLVGAIQRLEVVRFKGGTMTGEQATAILNIAKENRLGRIKNIRINRVAGMGSVSPSLLQEARLNSKLEWIV